MIQEGEQVKVTSRTSAHFGKVGTVRGISPTVGGEWAAYVMVGKTMVYLRASEVSKHT